MQRTYIFANFQRGISLVGLIFVLAVLGMVMVFGMKLVPAYAEYSAIKNAIKVAKEAGGTPAEMRSSFAKNAEVGDIASVKPRDLVISKETGETEISFAYEKRIPLAGNVSLAIDFSGTTDKSGIVAGKPAINE